MENTILVSSIEECLSLKNRQKIKFICKSCGKDVERFWIKKRKNMISRFLCKKCSSEYTCEQKFGYKNAAQSPLIMEKIQKTNLEKYGNVCSLNGKEQIEKKKATWKKNFGAENPYQKEDIKKKVEENNLKKYGQKYAFCTKEALKKAYRTRVTQGKIGSKVRYEFDNLKFDSSWELCFYIWHKDHKTGEIKRNQKVIDFVYEGKHHNTFVDFSIGSFDFEIKGSYLLYDDYQKARVQAMIDNGVIIIDDNSIKNYIRYVNNTYGRHFIDEFRS